MNRKIKRIGDILVESGVITSAQLEETLIKQKGTGKKLGEVLIEQRLVTERQI